MIYLSAMETYVENTNEASGRLAEKVGLRWFATLFHYINGEE